MLGWRVVAAGWRKSLTWTFAECFWPCFAAAENIAGCLFWGSRFFKTPGVTDVKEMFSIICNPIRDFPIALLAHSFDTKTVDVLKWPQLSRQRKPWLHQMDSRKLSEVVYLAIFAWIHQKESPIVSKQFESWAPKRNRKHWKLRHLICHATDVDPAWGLMQVGQLKSYHWKAVVNLLS